MRYVPNLRPSLVKVGQIRESGCQVLLSEQLVTLQLGLLWISRGASVGTICPMRVVLAGDGLVLVQVEPCVQETCHSTSHVRL